eukprot:2844296-Pleurochrysis_carterae.AAC.2
MQYACNSCAKSCANRARVLRFVSHGKKGKLACELRDLARLVDVVADALERTHQLPHRELDRLALAQRPAAAD